ncbi:hypothetical protein [Hymenobacter defluvii]|uniref:Uncharacterized protein n=1 Tax=Hymenobacter defluvii TaxID=2054411 RepID=A0ABS3THG1_9BACT|nr:hypothetical protein [Hymenobacter defluvii]MBO3273086.1 hypothetical protein [Hymenobacter defluvii]
MAKFPIRLEGQTIIWDSWSLTDPQRQVLLLLCDNDLSLFQQRADGVGVKTAAKMLSELLQNEDRFYSIPDLTPDEFAAVVELMFKFWTIGREVADACLVVEPT